MEIQETQVVEVVAAGQEAEDDGFVERLRQLVDSVGSANGLARRAGLSQSGFQRYLAGGQPTRRVLIALAKAAGVDLLWLMTGVGSPQPNGVVAGGDSLTRLPLYKFRQEREPARDGLVKPETVSGLGFCRFWLSKHGMDASTLVGLYMQGDSMEPSIANGDTVLVNVAQRDVADGHIYAVRDGAQMLVKRVQSQLAGRLRLISDNSRYAPFDVRREDIDVIGRVVWRGSLF